MPDFNELFQSEPAKRLMNNQNAINRLKTAPETQRLMEMLDSQVGGDLESAANAAANGSPNQLMNAMEKLLRDPESKKLLEQISKTMSF